MMGIITTEAMQVYDTALVDGLPQMPPKEDIIALFGTIEGALSSLTEGLIIGNAVVYSTQALLFADLAHNANVLGIVWADPDPTKIGVYIKIGASGTGSWLQTNLSLPSNFVAQLSAMQAEIDVADANIEIIRQTRFVSRPGEAIGAWTGQVNLAPDSATPLVASANYVIATGLGGRSLRVIGVRPVGPIATVYFEEGRTYRWQAILARSAGDGSGDLILPRARAFSAGMTDLGIVSMPSQPVPVAGGLTKIDWQLSSVPANSDGTIPIGTRYLRPYIATQGGNIDIATLDISDITDAGGGGGTGDLPAALAAATVVTSTTGKYVVLYDQAGNAVNRILIDNFETPDMNPTLYWYEASDPASTAAVPYIVNDPGLMKVRVQNTDDAAFVAVGTGGTTPELFSSGAWMLGPGGAYSEDGIEPGAVSIISDTDGSGVTVRFASTSALDPNYVAKAEILLARYPTVPTTAWQDAIRTLYAKLGGARILRRLRGLYILAAPNLTSSKLNWVGSTSLTVSGATFSAGQGMIFNGIDQYCDTGISVDSDTLFKQNDHSMWVFVDNTIQSNASQAAIGIGDCEMESNRTSTTMRVTSTHITDTITNGGAGGFFGFSRDNSADYNAYWNDGFSLNVTKDTAAVSTYSCIVGGSNGVSGPTNFYGGTIRMAAFGASLTAPQKTEFYNAVSDYITTVGAL